MADFDNTFHVKLYCVLLSTDIPNNKQYILSSKKDEIEIPYFDLDAVMLTNLDSDILAKMKELIFVSDIELIPQLISMHNSYLETKERTLNVVYGFLVKHTGNINTEKVFWQEFNYLTPNKYSNLIMQVNPCHTFSNTFC